jgi:hypothetical protein
MSLDVRRQQLSGLAGARAPRRLQRLAIAVARARPRARQTLSPPSTATVAPVMNALSSLARKTTTLAISAAVA